MIRRASTAYRKLRQYAAVYINAESQATLKFRKNGTIVGLLRISYKTLSTAEVKKTEVSLCPCKVSYETEDSLCYFNTCIFPVFFFILSPCRLKTAGRRFLGHCVVLSFVDGFCMAEHRGHLLLRYFGKQKSGCAMLWGIVQPHEGVNIKTVLLRRPWALRFAYVHGC